MKKYLSVILAITLLLLSLVGCADNSDSNTVTTTAPGDKPPAAPIDVKIVALKGPSAMGLVKFMSDADSGSLTDNNYKFSIEGSADIITPKIVKGEIDIAAVPANLASVLYNKTNGDISVLAVNTLGVLYIVESGDSVKSVADLKGKTIYASGKGSTPEYALNYILSGNGIDPEKDVTIEWKSEHTECLSALMANDNAIALLPQPFVTTAQTKSDNINVVLDLTAEWDALQKDQTNKSSMITGVVIARREFVEQNPDVIVAFLDHYKASVEYVKTNNDAAAALVGKYDIVPEAVAKEALPKCNITFVEGDEMKTMLSGYLSVLFDQNPTSVGGALPEDKFYFKR